MTNPLLTPSNQYNKLGLNQRQTFISQMRRILNKVNYQVNQVLVATPIKELGKHRVVDMAIGSTHSCLVVESGKVVIMSMACAVYNVPFSRCLHLEEMQKVSCVQAISSHLPHPLGLKV